MKTCICIYYSLLIALAMISAGSLAGVDAFQTHRRLVVVPPSRTASSTTTEPPSCLTLLAAMKKDKQQGVSSSGYRQDRLNKLAELESERIETDKGFVLKAAGGFVGFIVLLLVAAYAGGILDQV